MRSDRHVHIHTPPPQYMAQRVRRYCLTLNNPTEDEASAIAHASLKNVKRLIIGEEIGESGTPHYQGFVHLKNAMTLTALKKWLGSKRYHIERANGTDYEAWSYCAKDGSVLIQHGDEPSIEGELSDWEKIAQMVMDGSTNLEIISRYPSIAIRCQAALDRMRLEHERQNAEWRNLEVQFITGPTGFGKTRGVMEAFGYANVYRVQNYNSSMFDEYAGEDVIIFEEFRGQVRIEQMLNFLDGYPCHLPARYANKMAKFTKVFMLTNVEFNTLYPRIQENHPETWDAFKRRVHSVVSHW